MSTGSTSETNSVSSVTSNNKASSTLETEVNETSSSSSDGKDLFHSLKGHVSFAKQCLGLLQNQMKHAMDTLDILQDQVTKAQSTIDKIERKENKASKVKSVVGNDYKASIDDVTRGGVRLQSHRMIVLDGNGQPLYAIDKPGTSYGVPLQHQGGPCLCSACTTGGHPVYIGGPEHTCTEKGQQIITIHPGQAVYPIDEKQVASLISSCHDGNDETNGEPKAASPMDNYSSQKKRNCSCPTYIENSPKPESDEHCPHSPHSNYSNRSNTMPNVISNSSKSTSPIATQLLQVIDVLQNAGDDEGKELETSFTRSFRCESTHSSSIPFTGPVPRPIYTASGTGIIASGSRRTRKQDITPIKKEHQPRLQDTHYSDLDTERELPELMKVPPPVLAATLEPDFLVVPGNSYFADSPTSAGNAASREREKSTATRDDLTVYERRSSRESQTSGFETTNTSLTDVKKDGVRVMRSSSTSSMSQASDGSSRSPSESSISENCAPRGLEEPKDSDKCDRISRRRSQEITVRDKQKDQNSVYSQNSLHKHPNGDSTETRTSPMDSAVSTAESKRHTRSSLLNSVVKDGDLLNKQPSPLSPMITSGHAHKVTPLNSITTTGLVEVRRNQSEEYKSNPGIVRISHATPMSSAAPSTLSYQSKTDTLRITASPSHSNDKLKDAFAHNGGPESDISVVTTYSVAQIENDEANSPCTSPSKRPNILSRNRQGKKDIPQGIVVLVPTIEDAKQLIKSSVGNQGNTPILVPQNVVNQFSTNGEALTSSADTHVASVLPGKRPHFPETNVSHTRPKRRHNEPLVID